MPEYKDPLEIAKDVFDDFLRIADPESVPAKKDQPEPKDPKKVEAGRKGGKAGGAVGAKSLRVSKWKSGATKAAKTKSAKTLNVCIDLQVPFA